MSMLLSSNLVLNLFLPHCSESFYQEQGVFGDDQAALLNPDSEPLTRTVIDDSCRELEFRQYSFDCQSEGHH